MRVFLDANVLFSAAKSDGAIRRLLALLRERDHELCADDHVLTEARRNLAIKAQDGIAALESLLPTIHIVPLHPPDSTLTIQVVLPPNDLRVLQSAIQSHCQALVTGDRTHFGPLYGQSPHGVAIHSPRSLAIAVFQ